MKSNKIQHPNTTNTLIGVNIQEGKCTRNDVVLTECTGSIVILLQELRRHMKENLIYWMTKYFPHTVWQKIHLKAEALKVTAACCPLRRDNISQNRGQDNWSRTEHLRNNRLLLDTHLFISQPCRRLQFNPLSYTESRPQTNSSDTQRWAQAWRLRGGALCQINSHRATCRWVTLSLTLCIHLH